MDNFAALNINQVPQAVLDSADSSPSNEEVTACTSASVPLLESSPLVNHAQFVPAPEPRTEATC